MKGFQTVVLMAVVLAGLSACQAINPLSTLQTAAVAGVERPGQAPAFRDLPYGQLHVRINNGPTGRMLLAREESGTQQWLATDGKALWVRDGRIVASRGLRDDLHALHTLVDAPAPAQVVDAPDDAPASFAAYARSVQMPDIGLVLEYDLRKSGETLAIQLADGVRRLQRVEERVYHPASGERWTNEYWVDPRSGRALISNQKLPGTPYRVRLEAGSYSSTETRSHEPREAAQ